MVRAAFLLLGAFAFGGAVAQTGVDPLREADDRAREQLEPKVLPSVEQPYDSTKVYEVVDEMPQAGGSSTMKPTITVPEGCTTARVYVRFIVELNGSISDERVLKSTCPAMDGTVLEFLRKMPPWRPARLKGRPVRAHMTMPISFEVR